MHSDSVPLIAHVIFRLDTGGLENGLVNLINHLPATRYRHVLICLSECAPRFAQRFSAEVPILELRKREGNDLRLYWRIWRVLRELRPAIVHTRNLAALEAQLPATLAGVSGRVHSEHGWDVFDPAGTRRKYQVIRRAFKRFIKQYICVSKHLETYLRDKIGVCEYKLTQIYNGVDTQRFTPGARPKLDIDGFDTTDTISIGTVGRMHGVKNQMLLARAFAMLSDRNPGVAGRLRLLMVGDGPIRQEVHEFLTAKGLRGQAWLPGDREDIPRLMRAMDIFVLPSTAEGISNTILEAMATALPVVATNVGGNPELVVDNVTGFLVASDSPGAVTEALEAYVYDRAIQRRHGQAGHDRVTKHFSLERMVSEYARVYDGLLESRRARA